MKRNTLIYLSVSVLIILSVSACKKNYINGGKPEDINKFKNMTTYDVLDQDPAYDTLVQIIDAAGLKDRINQQGSTFFAPMDIAIFGYLNERTIYDQQNYDQNAKFDLDSLKYYLQNNINGTKDSLLMYLVNKPLTYSSLTEEGTIFPTELQGDTVAVSYETTLSGTLGYTNLVSQAPRVVYFTQLWYHYDLSKENPASKIPEDVGVRNLVKTSGINTSNGVLHLLDNSNMLFFYGTKQ